MVPIMVVDEHSFRNRALLGLAAFSLSSVLAYFTGGLDWLNVVAVLGTALGTLGLAAYTYQLARSTATSVHESEQALVLGHEQLKHIQSQVELSREQVAISNRQAEAGAQQVAAAHASTLEAAKARIDALAPMIQMTVEAERVLELDPEQNGDHTLQVDVGIDKWYHESDLRNRSFTVPLRVELRNVGHSPAELTVTQPFEFDNSWEQSPIGRYVLQPGQMLGAVAVERFIGEDASNSRLVEIVVTYDSLMHGEVFDRVQWYGHVSALQVADGKARRAKWVLNAWRAGQVIRSYPNLDRPEEMAQTRERLLNLQHPNASA